MAWLSPPTLSSVDVRFLVAAALSGVLTGLIVGSTAAGNFGSNTNSDDEVAHTCDTTLASQCVANNGTHVVYKVNLTANISAAVDHAVAEAHAIRDFSAFVWCCNDNTQDVNAHDGDYNNTTWWAYTACTPAATHGGTAPLALWCKPQDNVFNWDHADQWDAAPEGRRTVACHELGHSFGLRHTDDSASCMRNAQTTPDGYSPHDVDRVNGNY
jgi:hypothetical protein